MEVLKGKKNVGSVELCGILLKAADLTQVEEKLATWAVLEAEVELVLRLERIVHLHDKLVIDALLQGCKQSQVSTWFLNLQECVFRRGCVRAGCVSGSLPSSGF